MTISVPRTTATFLVLGTLILAYAVVFFFLGIGDYTRLLLSDISGAGAGIAAATACWIAGRRQSEYSSGWLWVAAGLGLWSLGEVAWSWLELVEDSQPFPSIADAFYTPSYLVLLIGIIKLSSASAAWGRARAVVDALIFAAAVAVPLWHHVLLPIFEAPDADPIEQSLSTFYPVADLVLLLALGIFITRQLPSSRMSLYVLAAGLLGMLTADVGFAFLSQSADYQPGSLVDLLWFAGLLTIGAAATLEFDSRVTLQKVQGFSVWQNLLPVMTLLPLALWIIYAANTEQIDVVTVTLIGVYALGLAARQIVGVLDMRDIHRDLESTHEKLTHLYGDLQIALRAESVLARQDSLTGQLNRQGILEEVVHLIGTETPFALTMADLDGLKTINDIHGHLTGDRVMQQFASLTSSLAATKVGRFGGDEFVILTKQPDMDSLRSDLESVRRHFEYNVARDFGAACSVSFGTARYPEDAPGIAELLNLADTRMYEVKRGKHATALRNLTESATPVSRFHVLDSPSDGVEAPDAGEDTSASSAA